MQKLKDFLAGADEIIEYESRWMKEDYKPDVVCLDAAFLPAFVAKVYLEYKFFLSSTLLTNLIQKVRIPSVVVSNFSFDAIFDAIARNPEEKALATKCRDMYLSTQYLIRLPGYIHFPAFNASISPESHIVDVPLVVRHHRRSRKDMRAELNIPTDINCALITFGGFELVGPGKAWTAETVLPENWYGIIAGPFGEGTAKGRLRWVPGEKYHLPDLVNAVDVVVGKLGYGTCAEVVAHQVPLVYVPRPKFVEEEGLLANLMVPYGVAVEMPQRDFYKGAWVEYILRAWEKGRGRERKAGIGCDGEVKACEAIVEIARNFCS
ncbi:hypothetical protein HDV00_008626 [Rhizophlyctis rosea]|nr:hypothetical protein HDV00_008626 [Rhizophlyctis rosea]